MQKAELDAEAAEQALDAEQRLFDSRENLFRRGTLPRKDLDQVGPRQAAEHTISPD